MLAVANRPGDSSYDRALLGRYPPGSTFKVVTHRGAAARRPRPRRDRRLPGRRSPSTGKSFRNFEGSAAGAVPFREDFAQSCNTAFVSLAGRLGERRPHARSRATSGSARSSRPACRAAAADVPPPRDAVGQAAMMIGQDRILASPLAMAGVAATVADGRWRAPRLLARRAARAGPRRSTRPSSRRCATLMRGVVTGGTGTALAGLPGEVIGKSGTAEYGGGDPPPTHAWFIAARGDLAVAVLVERGELGRPRRRADRARASSTRSADQPGRSGRQPAPADGRFSRAPDEFLPGT